MPDKLQQLQIIARAARDASRILALASTDTKNKALQAIANAIRQHQSTILQANAIDLALAKEKDMPNAFLDRLELTAARIESMTSNLESIAMLPDPVRKILVEIKRPNGLEIKRVAVPIGVIGVIYESRPNVTADAAGLCLKSGNAVILRGGGESFNTSIAIMDAINAGLKETNLPETAVQMIPTTDREAVSAMLKLDKDIDVIIPRGGQALIERISSESRIPLFKHLAGLCHTYVHKAADLEMAKKIVLNAKMRRTGICGATETLLIDEAIVASHLVPILDELITAGCEVRGDEQSAQLDSRVKLATYSDYDTEFLDAIISVKVVKDLTEAIQHITQHGTQHTDAIITDDTAAASRFLNEVDSAIVMHNASTQFADGGEFGMGAEMGIATGKLHARGPVGLEQLTTFKYLVEGTGQIRKR